MVTGSQILVTRPVPRKSATGFQEVNAHVLVVHLVEEKLDLCWASYEIERLPVPVYELLSIKRLSLMALTPAP